MLSGKSQMRRLTAAVSAVLLWASADLWTRRPVINHRCTRRLWRHHRTRAELRVSRYPSTERSRRFCWRKCRRFFPAWNFATLIVISLVV